MIPRVYVYRTNLSKAFITLSLFFLSCLPALASETHYLDAVPDNAVKPIGLLLVETEEFAPARGESFTVPFALDVDARVTLDILGPDGDLIRTLVDDEMLAAGRHEFRWDGQDLDGILVPDEAYLPRLTVNVADSGTVVTTIDDPARYSGGEILPNIEWTRRRDTEISYNLPVSARVLIRSGVEEGPMVRELMHWEPVAAGRAVLRWDGYDADQVDRFAERDDTWTVVMAYRLPEYAIITSGNPSLDYRAYRKLKDWEPARPVLIDTPLERRGQRLSRDYFLPRGYLPRVSLMFVEQQPLSRFGMPIVTDEVLLRIDVPKEDRWILDSSFYETGFYVNYQFNFEEEQGFLPMVWSLDTSNLIPGRHLATVQLFGFGGFIASATIEFLVEPD